MAELGKLTKVDLRKVWAHEARDFSAWLAKEENLASLSETVGIDIGLIGTEVEAGRYRIDILANDLNTDHKVIIENQLEPTDHDHLGKIITYAAGHDAKYIIWIVKEVLAEHQKAVEWLNEYLDEDIRIFLIRIEVWQIGDSAYAPKFEIISAKNDWAAVVKKTATSGDYSETKLKQQQFWADLVEYIRSKDSNIRLHSPLPQHWQNFSMGFGNINIVATINTRENKFTTDIYVRNEKEFKAFMEPYLDELSKALGEEISWWEGEKDCGFRTSHVVNDVFASNNKEANMEWIYQRVLLLKKVMTPYIQKYRNEH